MFDLISNLFGNNGKDTVNKDKIAKILQTNTEALEAFEKAYKTQILSTVSDNFFEVNAKQAVEEHEGIVVGQMSCDLIERIVEELVVQTPIFTFDGEKITTVSTKALPDNLVSLEDIKNISETIQPQLTGTLMKKDINEPVYPILAEMYERWIKKKDIHAYHMFRQGLDIMDLDPVAYEIIGMNVNSMGHWLPEIVKPVVEQRFFKIPKTKIIKVPITMLQLTRQDYASLTRTTLDIVDLFCKKVFDLDENQEYFIKTGTYSSKFDFRNAYVHGAKEVRELGEYLLYIHFQALQMASPLAHPCIYGVSTTNEWVVREFIHDKENNPCIYKGLPLHTEYRVFVDFDTNEVIGINPYWDPNVMKNRFGNSEDSDSPHNVHDYVIYKAHEDKLMERYNQNKDLIVEKVGEILSEINLSGQWSLDIMQNGDDFWIIDMALAQNSALIECVPRELRRTTEENWIPKLEIK